MAANRKRKDPVFTPRTALAGFLLMLVLLAEVFFDTWCAVQCRRAGYEIVRAESHRDELVEMQRKLEIEIVHLKSPSVLGSRAKTDLGLITPRPGQIIGIR